MVARLTKAKLIKYPFRFVLSYDAVIFFIKK